MCAHYDYCMLKGLLLPDFETLQPSTSVIVDIQTVSTKGILQHYTTGMELLAMTNPTTKENLIYVRPAYILTEEELFLQPTFSSVSHPAKASLDLTVQAVFVDRTSVVNSFAYIVRLYDFLFLPTKEWNEETIDIDVPKDYFKST